MASLFPGDVSHGVDLWPGAILHGVTLCGVTFHRGRFAWCCFVWCHFAPGYALSVIALPWGCFFVVSLCSGDVFCGVTLP